jgi:uncharacterized protein (DUF1501 family)
MSASRRHFLSTAAALSGGMLGARASAPFALSLAGLGAMAAQSASAADTSGPYKALVCLFMSGGNDSHNWVVPTDTRNHADYLAARRELAWPLHQLLGLSSPGQAVGRSFGMPQELQPLHALYEAGRCAVVANVGTLQRPTTKADFLADRQLPSKLFSHNDQQSTWQSLAPEGARSGWGGRMGDVLMSANQHPVFTAVSGAGNAVFLAGEKATQYQVGPAGPVGVGALGRPWTHGSTTTATALRRVLQAGAGNDFQSEYSRVMQRSLDTSALLQSALASTSVAPLPSLPIRLPSGAMLALQQDHLAQQLRVVAQMVAAAPRLGMRRQVFMVNIGGFDSHVNQMRDQPWLMASVAHAVGWFFGALDAQGLGSNVTLFTASDFGRTLNSNGQGSDHGWGAHHFVVGGAVRGRKIYGSFPSTALGSADDVGSGRLLPSTSVTQYAATLGRWMGLSSTELSTVLPTLGNFSSTNLGFV